MARLPALLIALGLPLVVACSSDPNGAADTSDTGGSAGAAGAAVDEAPGSGGSAGSAGAAGSSAATGGGGQAGTPAVDAGAPKPEAPVNDGLPSVSAAQVQGVSCKPQAPLYFVDGSGQLVRFVHADPNLGSAKWSDSKGTTIGKGWQQFSLIASGGRAIFYAVDASGALRWYRRGASSWATGSGATIGTGFGAMGWLLGGGNGMLHAIKTSDGALRWYRHKDPYAGAKAWAKGGGSIVGKGFGGFRDVVAGGNGVEYAITKDGKLKWYRHEDPFGGGDTWAKGSGAVVGNGWDRFAYVTSAGGGVLYAVDAVGDLYWFRHADPAGGSAKWQTGSGKKLGSGFEVFAAALAEVDVCELDAYAIPPLVSGAVLKWGLHPDASDALRSLGIGASMISQTIGNAPASAGYHAQDGVADGNPYSAATDLSVKTLNESQIKTLLERMGRLGFAAFYRKPGYDGWPSSEAPHIHAVYAACAMKSQLDGQISDFEKQLNGLASHTTYKFYTWSSFDKKVVLDLWQGFN